MNRAHDRPFDVPYYHQGVIEGFEFAVAQVCEMQAIQDPQELRENLRALANELDRQGQQELQTTRQNYNLIPLLLGGMGEMEKQIRSGGKSAGHYEAAAIIRWFLSEQ